MDNNISETVPADSKPMTPTKSAFGGAPKQPGRLTLWIVAAVLVLGVVVAFALGLVAVVFKSPHQKTVLAGNSCGTTVVERYNTAMTAYYGDGRAAVLKSLTTLSDEIAKGAGWEQDASCLFIRYRVASLTSNYAVAKDMLAKLEVQVERGNSPDGRLDGLGSVKDMARTVELLNPDKEEPDDF